MDRWTAASPAQRMQRNALKGNCRRTEIALRLRAALRLGWGDVGVLAKSGLGEVLTEGPHSQIAKDPQRHWAQDL